MISIKLKRLIKEGYLDIRDFGLRVGLARWNCILCDESLVSIQRKNQAILKKLEREYSELLEKYRDCKESELKSENAPIWMLWWDGELPEVLKMCYNSRMKHAGKHRIVVITKENVHEYVTFPDYVWQQFESGKLRIQHLADMIRVQLLRNYGGLWLDASVYCSTDIPEHIFSMPLYSLSGKPDPRFVSNNRWTTFVIGGYKNNVLCSFLDDFFQEYCHRGKRFIDYFMFDCAIALAYNSITAVRTAVDDLPYEDGDCYLLDRSLDEQIEDIMLPVFSKISWGRFCNREAKIDTLYARLLHEEGIHG